MQTLKRCSRHSSILISSDGGEENYHKEFEAIPIRQSQGGGFTSQIFPITIKNGKIPDCEF